MKKYNKTFTGVNFSTGNRKLVPNKDTKFLIWNLPAVKTCPFRTEHCEKACYARKAERVYPQALPSRIDNYHDSLAESFVWDTISTIKYFQKRWRTAKRIIIRIHESGDFYSLDYMRKWYDIAWYFKHNSTDSLPSIEFTAYTKSVEYIKILDEQGDNVTSMINIRASVWDDTPSHQLKIIEDLKLPTYTAFEKGLIPSNYTKCKCEDCASCLKCYNNIIKLIACEIH